MGLSRHLGLFNRHLPSFCLDLTIVIAYWLGYRNQRLLLFSVFRTVRTMVLNLRPRDIISVGLRQLHWLPIESRIQFKLSLLLLHLIQTGRCPSHISDTVQLVADYARRTDLPSTSFYFNFTVHSTKTACALFFVLWPKAWNSLPGRFHLIESTVSLKKLLKTFLSNHSV